jgi:serine/threonine protein kinase
LVEGFKDIYKKGVMHRDLKLANIMVHLPNEDLTFGAVKDLDLKK